MTEQERVIGGTTYKVRPLGHTLARKVFVRAAKAIGPAAAAAAEDPAKAVGALVENVTDSDLEWIADVFGKVTQYEGPDGWPFLHKDARELRFGGGKLFEFFEWLAFCLEVNYADFFAFAKLVSADAARERNQSPS